MRRAVSLSLVLLLLAMSVSCDFVGLSDTATTTAVTSAITSAITSGTTSSTATVTTAPAATVTTTVTTTGTAAVTTIVTTAVTKPPAHVHAYGGWVVVYGATCAAPGLAMRACTCGEGETEAIAKLSHTPSDWIVDRDPTYLEEGIRHRECLACGTLLQSEPIPTLQIPPVVYYTVSYSVGAQSGSVTVAAGEGFTLPVAEKKGYSFSGYYAADGTQVTDEGGRMLSSYVLSSDIDLTAVYSRLPGEADRNGEYLGNPGELYYKSTSFVHKMARNPWDMALYNGKLYVGGGYYGGAWISAPPLNVYDTATGEWSYTDFEVRMYEAFDGDSTEKAWHTLPAANSSSSVVVGSIKDIPVTTDCEISTFRWIGDTLYILGADSINEYTWADGTVSKKLPTEVDPDDTQGYVKNLSGNYYVLTTDEDGNDVFAEYRNHVMHGTHVYDVIEIDYNGGKALMFAVGTSGTPMPVKIQTGSNPKSYLSPKFYRKDGTLYSGNSNNRVYNFFKTDEGIFAFYAHQGGTDKKIFKYNVVNGEHRFDEVRDITINATTSDTENYQQSDVNSSGTAITTRRLYTDFMKTETYAGSAYYTTGYLYKTKTFLKSETTKITAPNGAIVTDLLVRDGTLYVLGFVKTNGSTNAYTNYVWSLDESDRFTEIRSFTSTGAYALSFEKDSEFFYVGLGGPTTHITSDVTSVGDIIKLAIRPIG